MEFLAKRRRFSPADGRGCSMSGEPYSREKQAAFCPPHPKGSISQSELCGVMRTDEPGLCWFFCDLAWSDHQDDRVLYVGVSLLPKGE